MTACFRTKVLNRNKTMKTLISLTVVAFGLLLGNCDSKPASAPKDESKDKGMPGMSAEEHKKM